MSRAGRRALVLTAAALWGAAAPVAAALTLPVTLGAGISPQLAASGDGAAVVAWHSREGENTVRVALRRGAGRPWEPAAAVAPEGVREDVHRVGMGPAGDALVAWTTNATNVVEPGAILRDGPPGIAIEGSYRAAGSPTWPGPEPISPPGLAAVLQEVAIGPGPSALAVWLHYGGYATVAERAPDGAWRPEYLGRGAIDSIRLAITPAGAAIAIWRERPNAVSTVFAAVRPVGAPAFGPAVALSGPSSGSRAFESPLRLAVGANGTAVAVWVRTAPGEHQRVEAAVLAPAAVDFGPAAAVSPPDGDALAPDVAVDAAGGATVAWQRADPRQSDVNVAARPAGARGWGTPQRLSAPGARAFSPRVAAGGPGAAVVVWTRARRRGLAVEEARRARGGARFAPPRLLFDPPPGRHLARLAQVAMDRRDRALVVWEQSRSYTSAVVRAVDLEPGP